MNSSASRKVRVRKSNQIRYCLDYAVVGGFCIFVVVVFAVPALIIFRSDQPPPVPSFSVSSFTAIFINASSPYQITLNFTVRKPKSYSTKTIFYDDIVASLYYDNNVVGTTTLFPFEQEEERNSVAVIKAKFTVDPKIHVDVGGVLCVRVSMIAALRDKRYARRGKLDIFCEDIRVESGSMVEFMKDCRVEGSLV